MYPLCNQHRSESLTILRRHCRHSQPPLILFCCASDSRPSRRPTLPMNSSHSARRIAHHSKYMPPLHSAPESSPWCSLFSWDLPPQSRFPMVPMLLPRKHYTPDSLIKHILRRRLQQPLPRFYCALDFLSNTHSTYPKGSRCSLHTTGFLLTLHRHHHHL